MTERLVDYTNDQIFQETVTHFQMRSKAEYPDLTPAEAQLELIHDSGGVWLQAPIFPSVTGKAYTDIAGFFAENAPLGFKRWVEEHRSEIAAGYRFAPGVGALLRAVDELGLYPEE